MSNIFLMSTAIDRRTAITFRLERDEKDSLAFRAVPSDPVNVGASFLRNLLMRVRRGVPVGLNMVESKREIAQTLAAAFRQTDEYRWLRKIGAAHVKIGGGVTHECGMLPSAAISIVFRERCIAEHFEADFFS